MANEPFQSWQETRDFESKVEAARKWITEAACSRGYEQPAVKVEFYPDAVTFRLTIQDQDAGLDFTDNFDRRLIEGIAGGDVPIKEEAYRRIQCIPSRRA